MLRQDGRRTAYSVTAATSERAAQIAPLFHATSLISTPALDQNTPHSASNTSARRWSEDITPMIWWRDPGMLAVVRAFSGS